MVGHALACQPGRTSRAGQTGKTGQSCPVLGPRAAAIEPPGVHDMKVETLVRCGAGWQPARRLATAAVRCQRGIWPIDNRPQLAKLPHKRAIIYLTHKTKSGIISS